MPQRLSRKFCTCNGLLQKLWKHNTYSSNRELLALHWYFTRQYDTIASKSFNNSRYNNDNKTDIKPSENEKQNFKLTCKETKFDAEENQKLVNILRQQISQKKPLIIILQTYTQASSESLNLLTHADYMDLLTSLKACENKFLVLNFLSTIRDDLRSMNLTLNDQAYNLMLHLYGQHNNYKKVERLLIEMRDKGISVDVDILNSLISNFARIGRADWVIPIYQEMQHGLAKPNIETYNIMLELCIQVRNLRGAHYLLTMEHENIKLDITFYNQLIDAYSKRKDFTRANECLDLMESRGLAPDISTIKILLIASCDQDDFQHALRLYRKIFELKLRPDEEILDSLTACYERSKRKDNRKKEITSNTISFGMHK
ncbi:7830_t:CDS:1 [Ambispora leptoticha]|uniref:7830_t:CDS:1 n=1 Tax=Ambispora leptoticha TaxID=144679 RepID=A0A9N9HU59_9GLOM|nr:7830_t:CDS:1 [Ambispora leptoticha]